MADETPGWAIAIALVLIVVVTLVLTYCILRRRSRRSRAVDAIVEKRSSFASSFRTLVASKLKTTDKPSDTNVNTWKCSDKAVDVEESSIPSSAATPPLDHISLSLPMPPTTTCLFSDKMELNSEEAQALFDQYVKQKDDFVSIDLSDTPFYSSAAANIQHKAATIKSTLRQSLRRKSKSAATPAHQLFNAPPVPKTKDDNKNQALSRQSSTASHVRCSPNARNELSPSPVPPVSPSPPVPSPAPTSTRQTSPFHPPPSSSLSMSENKKKANTHGMTNMQPSISDSYRSPQKHNDTEEDNEPKSEEDEEGTMHAARRVIRSASRKARSRSMIVNPESTQCMFQEHETDIPSPALPKPNKNIQRAGTIAARHVTDQTNFDGTIRGSRKPSIPDAWRAPLPTSNLDDTVAERHHAPHPPPLPITGSATMAGKTATAMAAKLQTSEGQYAQTLGRNAMQRPGFAATGSTRGVKSLRAMFDQGSGNNQTSSEEKGSSAKHTVPDFSARDSQPSVRDTEDVASAEKLSDENRTGRSNVDTIRRMLQATWNANNLKESGSMTSITSSEMSGHSTLRMMGISPPGSINPRLQNQHLVSLSLKARQQAPRRPAMPSGFMTGGGDELQGPTPTASFSSSTVRTMIPEDEQPPIAETKITRDGTISKRITPNTIGHQSYDTMRQIGRQQKRGGLPWTEDKTAAQRERF
ncbi:hypothetical protein EC973_009257 [Apophysomyces ossiformis]|uniref:Uncharacterized protein n=1 Tax=Apophysomyces ossiformis TaxID=679940 RepID=A0A8H7EPP0_9FUNG|nr:hypothetical protein EC973_009257 [Apophysomyces ossiformis]